MSINRNVSLPLVKSGREADGGVVGKKMFYETWR